MNTRRRDARGSRLLRRAVVLSSLLLMLGGAALLVLETMGHDAARRTEGILSGRGPEEVTWRPGRVGVTSDGLKHAPDPREEFRDAQCPLTVSRAPGPARASAGRPSWRIGEGTIGGPLVEEKRPASGAAVPESAVLPAAPEGLVLGTGAPLEAGKGTILIAGHVDDEEGRLSPWGYLNGVGPCSLVTLSSGTGETRSFVVTDLYTVPQEEIVNEPIFTTHGPLRLAMVTCAGATRESFDAVFGFQYAKNLVLIGRPVVTDDKAPASSTRRGNAPLDDGYPQKSPRRTAPKQVTDTLVKQGEATSAPLM